MVNPPISAKEAKQGVELLLRLNLLKVQDGKYVQADAAVTTGGEVQSIAVANFQRALSDLSKRAITRMGNQQEISTLTFGPMTKVSRKYKRKFGRFEKS